jgi:hypothetical protein
MRAKDLVASGLVSRIHQMILASPCLSVTYRKHESRPIPGMSKTSALSALGGFW